MFGGDSAVVIHPMAGLIAHPCCRADISRKPVYPCFARLIGLKRNSLSRLWLVQMNDHSPLTFFSLRIRNCWKPRPCLIWPKTGATVAMRIA